MKFWKKFIKSMDLNNEKSKDTKVEIKKPKGNTGWSVAVLMLLIIIAVFCTIGRSYFLSILFWFLAILQIIYMYKNRLIPKEREKQKEEQRQKYLKKFRIWKLTIGEWIAITILVVFVLFLVIGTIIAIINS